MGKDVTLHVSASNPAMLLYQKFGFKTEEYVLDFYDKYYPLESTECKHAFFLRLRRWCEYSSKRNACTIGEQIVEQSLKAVIDFTGSPNLVCDYMVLQTPNQSEKSSMQWNEQWAAFSKITLQSCLEMPSASIPDSTVKWTMSWSSLHLMFVRVKEHLTWCSWRERTCLS